MTADHHHPPSASIDPIGLARLAAVAEPNRARLLDMLRHGEHCVCDLAELLGMSTALVSHHLRALREAGLLRERRKGRWVFYSLDLEGVAELRDQVTALLTPMPSSPATCGCTDCGPRSLVDRRVGTGVPA